MIFPRRSCPVLSGWSPSRGLKKICMKRSLLLLGICSVFFAIGCGSAQKSQPLSKGELVYKNYACSACHMINQIGGKIGPDLSWVGTRHSREWLKNWITNPQQLKPGTMMPKYSFSPSDLENLLDYLESLRGVSNE